MDVLRYSDTVILPKVNYAEHQLVAMLQHYVSCYCQLVCHCHLARDKHVMFDY